MNDYAKEKADQDGLPQNCFYKSKKGNVAVYVRNWADVLANAKQRYEFFSKKLKIEAQKEHGMKLWKEKYSHLLTGRGASKNRDIEITSKKENK